MASWQEVYELARQGLAAGEIMVRLRLKPYRFRQILQSRILTKALQADTEMLAVMLGCTQVLRSLDPHRCPRDRPQVVPGRAGAQWLGQVNKPQPYGRTWAFLGAGRASGRPRRRRLFRAGESSGRRRRYFAELGESFRTFPFLSDPFRPETRQMP